LTTTYRDTPSNNKGNSLRLYSIPLYHYITFSRLLDKQIWAYKLRLSFSAGSAGSAGNTGS